MSRLKTRLVALGLLEPAAIRLEVAKDSQASKAFQNSSETLKVEVVLEAPPLVTFLRSLKRCLGVNKGVHVRLRPRVKTS